MLTTKAFITATPEEGDNVFKVNIPLMADNVNDEAIFDALLCSSSGNYNDYKVGDCVFVDFEDDKYNTAIIMGKLYTEVPNENEAYGLYNELKVTGSAILPEDTRIGPYTTQDIFNLYQAAQNFKLEDRDYVEFYMLKKYLEKSEFNKFFGDAYFSDMYPYSENDESSESKVAVFDNVLETGDKGNEKYNTKFAPDFKTLRNTFKTFLQKTLSILYGLNLENNESISQIVAKISANKSQDYDGSKVGSAGVVDDDNYFPHYQTLVSNLKSFFNTDLPKAFNKLDDKFVQYYNADSIKAKKLKVCTQYNQQYPSGNADSETIYFCTYVPN